MIKDFSSSFKNKEFYVFVKTGMTEITGKFLIVFRKTTEGNLNPL